MVERSEHEQAVIEMSLANLKRLGYFDELRAGLKDVETFDMSQDDEKLNQELRSRRAQLVLLDEIESEAERAENNLAEGKEE
jgi:hypothetical protein